MTTATAGPAPVVQRFAQALLSGDEDALVENSTDDLTWTIPGHGPVSGVHLGVPAVIAVAETIRRHGITIEVEQILAGRDGVTAILSERGNRPALRGQGRARAAISGYQRGGMTVGRAGAAGSSQSLLWTDCQWICH